ncbi:MAG: microcin C transport system substrate-binding protein [Saprospiraceae bacterium]|jgi:microcin C transport system substrate-binding protein
MKHHLAVSICALLLSTSAQAAIHKSHAITLYDEAPKYAEGFSHFDYANPDAPKGGIFRVAPVSEATFDSFHPFISKGNPVSTGAVETLLTASLDEPFTEYGLIAEYIEWPDERDWVTFHINPKAKWHDGMPITADDVIWTFNTLIEKGRPAYRFYYASVEKVEKLDKLVVKFTFNESNNRELPMVVGQLPVLPKHYWEDKDFEKTTLEPPLGSGPYQITDHEPGRFIEQSLVDNYWGKDLAVNRGMYNFGKQRTDFYRDVTAIRLALKAGKIDFRQENQAKAWATEYENLDSIDEGRLIKRKVAHQQPTGMQGLMLNTRRANFSNPLTREALTYAFDFEWTNRNLFFSQYTRTRSYFSNSTLASTGLPSEAELAVLEPHRGQLPARIFTEEYNPPATDGSGWPRDNLLKADALLKQAGWIVKDLKRVNAETGEPFEFEILLVSKAFERIMLPMVRNLNRLGIEAKIRLVDTSQYINRLRSFDFDAMVSVIGQSENPGNEQREYWTQDAAAQEGSRNYPGVSSEVVDSLVDNIIKSKDRESLIANTRALDRVLLYGFYVIPNWHLAADRVLYWNKFGIPDTSLKSGVVTTRWWIDEAKANTPTRELETDVGSESVDSNSSATDSTNAQSNSNTRILGIVALLCMGVFMLKRYFRRKS